VKVKIRIQEIPIGIREGSASSLLTPASVARMTYPCFKMLSRTPTVPLTAGPISSEKHVCEISINTDRKRFTKGVQVVRSSLHGGGGEGGLPASRKPLSRPLDTLKTRTHLPVRLL
jgi:hypothetical protein